MKLLALFFFAVLVEASIDYFGAPIPSQFKKYAAFALALIVCLAYQLDFPTLFGLPGVPYIGPGVTALVVGRGSNFLATFIKRLSVISAPAQSVSEVTE